jgi:hypothetical protein
MASKIASRHIKLSAEILGVGLAVSALSVKVSRPNPIWVDGQQFKPAAFSATDYGLPLPFIHTSCYGDPLTCHSHLDPWAFILNSLVWAVIAAAVLMAIVILRKRSAKRVKK